MEVANTIVYYNAAKIMTVKSFRVQTLEKLARDFIRGKFFEPSQ
jgi:hypothetical protein